MDPIRLFRLEMLGFLVVLTVMLVCRMLTRQINLSGLLGDRASDKTVTVERVQLLAVSLIVGAKCVVNLVRNPSGMMPGVGGWWLLLFGASAVVYAVMKWLRAFRWQ